MRIHITGASGTGTTTLSKKLAEVLNCVHFDNDSYFWLPTEPPFTFKRPTAERDKLLLADLQNTKSWILSGCKCNWTNANTDYLYDLVVFLYVPGIIRMERLKKREIERFGVAALLPSGYFHENHLEFMEWASSYDTGNLSTRSKALHEHWLKTLSCDILRLENDHPVEQNHDSVIHFIEQLA